MLLLLPAATVLLPVLLFLTLGRAVSLCTLFFLSAGASLAMAAVLRWRVYTRKSGAEEWYQRWNPFAADAAAFVLVTFLLVQGFAVSLPGLPSGLYVDRLTVADSELRLQIDRCGEPIHVQLEAPQTEVSGVKVPLPTGSDATLDFAIAGIEILTSSITLASGSEGNDELALLSVAETAVDDVHVVVDIEEARVEDVRAGLRLSGELESKSLREDLQRVRFLKSRAKELSTSTFALALQLSRSGGQGAAVGEVPAYDPNDAQFVTHGSLVVALTACTLEYTTRTRLRPGGLDLAISADGDTEAVNIRSIRSTGDSRVKVTGGSGTVSLGDAIVSELRLHGLEAALRDSQAHVASAELDAAVPISCGSDAGQRFGAIVNKVILENAERRVDVGSATVGFRLGGGTQDRTVSLETRLEDLEVKGFRSDAADPDNRKQWLTLGIPATDLRVSGTTTAEMIPREFDGEVSLSVTRPNADSQQTPSTAFKLDRPLRVSANLWQGRIDVPEQSLVLEQSVVPQLPSQVPVEFSLHGDIGGKLNGNARIEQFVLDLAPAQVLLNDLNVTAELAWTDEGLQPTASLRSALNHVKLPSLPGSFQLGMIAKLDLKTQGTIRGLPLDEATVYFPDLPSLCTDLPSLDLNPFRLEGEWSAHDEVPFLRILGEGEALSEVLIRLPSGEAGDLQVQIGPDRGLRIEEASNLIERLSVPGARFQGLDAQLNLTGIHTLDGQGNLNISTDLALSDLLLELSTSIAEADDPPLLGLDLKRSESRIEQALSGDLLLDELTPAVTPFLGQFGCNLDWITPQAKIRRLAGELEFSDQELSKFEINVDVAPGKLAFLKLAAIPDADDENPPFFQEVGLKIESDPSKPEGLQLHAEGNLATSPGRLLKISATSSRLLVQAVDRNAEQHRAVFDLNGEASGSFKDQSEDHPVVEKLLAVGSDLGSQLQNAQRIFGEPADALDLDWKFEVHNSVPDKPFVSLEQDEMELGFVADLKHVEWRLASQEEASRLTGSGRFAIGSKVHQEHLVVDGLASDLDLSLPVGELQWSDLELPFLVVLRDELVEAPAGGENFLWDGAVLRKVLEQLRPFPSQGSPDRPGGERAPSHRADLATASLFGAIAVRSRAQGPATSALSGLWPVAIRSGRRVDSNGSEVVGRSGSGDRRYEVHARGFSSRSAGPSDPGRTRPLRRRPALQQGIFFYEGFPSESRYAANAPHRPRNGGRV